MPGLSGFRAFVIILLCVAGTSHFTPSLQGQGPAQTYVGILNVIWADGQAGQSVGGDPQFSLIEPGGRVLALEMNGQEGAAYFNFGKEVRIVGRPVASAAGAAAAGEALRVTLRVDSLVATDARATAESPVSGTKKVIFLLVKFSDDATTPHPASFYLNLTNPDTPPAGEHFPSTINGFFKKTSGNLLSWTGDVGGVGGLGAPGGWLTLPHTKSYYAPCGWGSSCALLGTLAIDATALGRAQGINFTVYDNINFVLNNDLDCCAWGGGFFSSVDNKDYGATWEPPWGQETGTYVHEMGHSIGLPHSGWVYFAYDSLWDMMSSRAGLNSMNCGSYFSFNSGAASNLSCTEPGDGYIGPHREFLGWIPGANEVVLSAGSGATVDLEGSALPFGAATKLIKICVSGFPCTGSSARFFTVEARVKNLGATSQFDNGIPGEGVIIHDVMMNRPSIGGSCFFNTQSGWALPVDATPGDYDSAGCGPGGRFFPNYALYNAQWLVGQTYVNSVFGFSVAVQSRVNSIFHVVVTALALPIVTTSPATNVTMNGATLNGTVNPNGTNATAVFDYGLTTAYGSQVAASPAPGSGSSPVAVSATVGQLICGTTYHFRAAATNGVGSGTGTDASFLTSACTSTLSVSPATLNFGATKNGAGGALVSVTPTQAETVGFTGAVPSWTATSSQAWIQINNGSGTGAKSFTVEIVNPGNAIGNQTTLQGSITVTAPTAHTYTVGVTLRVQQVVGQSAAPFGQVDSPAQNAANQQGAIGLTGWVLDDIGVQQVKVYRPCLSFDVPASCANVGGNNLVFVGDAAFLAGARPDVEAAFQGVPLNYRGGWGMQILSNVLPHIPNQLLNGGQGTFPLYVYAFDYDGHMTLIGRGTNDHTPTSVQVNNDAIAKPFGTIDTPLLGETISGSKAVFGWVLTPDANTVPDGGDILMATSGAGIVVYIDSVSTAIVSYNQCRDGLGTPPSGGRYCTDDIANIFGRTTPAAPLTARSSNPTRFRNLDADRGAIGVYTMDTTLLSNGLHTIAWGVADSASRGEGIGSRFFTVLNAGASPSAASVVELNARPAVSHGSATTLETSRPSRIRVSSRTGFGAATLMRGLVADGAGVRTIAIGTLGRVELSFGVPVSSGYLIANGEWRDLPVGSTLDRAEGTFAWAPPPGYFGAYRLVFVLGAEHLVIDITVGAK